MLLLGIAYAANIGGTGTLIGTPPNLVSFRFLISVRYTMDSAHLPWHTSKLGRSQFRCELLHMSVQLSHHSVVIFFSLEGDVFSQVMFQFIQAFPGQPVTFASWLLFATPLMVFNLGLAWIWLQV